VGLRPLSFLIFCCPDAPEFSMLGWLTHLDRLLRGDVTRPEELREGRINIDAGGMAVMIVLLGMIYGLCMGSYSLLKEVPANFDPNMRTMQLVATTIKVPALFYLTLLVTFPSLYVFNALVGSRLTLTSVLRLLVASLAVNLAVLASLGPIVLFFSLSTKTYAFIQLLNVVMFTVAGILGLIFLLQTLHRLTMVGDYSLPRRVSNNSSGQSSDLDDTVSEAPATENLELRSALDMPEGQSLGRHTRSVFTCWVIVFALVGAQMGWVLRPFIGDPTLEFSWFRERKSNFFEAVLNAISTLFTGGG
jgi:hypothetical protein